MSGTVSVSLNSIERVRRRLRRIMYMAGNGFYQSMGENTRLYNRFFLEILKEAYKALNETRNLETSETGEASI